MIEISEKRQVQRKATESLVRMLHPDARFMTWSEFDCRDAKAADELRSLVCDLEYELADVVLYEHKGGVSIMYPPEVAGDV